MRACGGASPARAMERLPGTIPSRLLGGDGPLTVVVGLSNGTCARGCPGITESRAQVAAMGPNQSLQAGSIAPTSHEHSSPTGVR